MPPPATPEDEADLAALDARLAGDGPARWRSFYADRARPCPFFVTVPDDSLARWVAEGRIRPGRALDVGCGNGRNAIFLARHGFAVQGVDVSASALAWAREEADRAGVDVALHEGAFADLPCAPASLDLVVDAGCFHHVAPHRRDAHLRRVAELLRPGGALALACFAPEGGSGLSDDEVYARGTLGGGLGYAEDRLRAIVSPWLEVESLERMRDRPAGADTFGRDFLWALLARRR